MMNMMDIVLIALFIEAIVNTLKPIWTAGEKKMTVSEFVAMGIGILLAVTCRIDMLGSVVEIAYDFPGWVQYVFYVLTGIAIGRGTNFLYDLWQKLLEWKGGNIAPGFAVLEEPEIDVEITHWSLKQLQTFCELNGIQAAWCVDREDYIEAITNALTNGRNEPPEEGGAE